MQIALALVLSQLLFALFHVFFNLRQPQGQWLLLAQFVMGLAFAGIYLRTGNLFLAMGVHTLSNNVSPLLKEPFDGPGLGGGLIMSGTLLAVVFGPRAVQFGRRWVSHAELGRSATGRMGKQMDRYVDPTEQLVVELLVRDLTRSVTFYRALGFDLLREEPRFAILAWEGHQLFLQQAGDLPEPPVTAVINLRVMVPDVDPIWQRATELGPRIIVPIGDRHYGLRDFTILDPDGFELRFATRLPAAR